MNMRTIATLAVAIVLGLFAVMLVRNMLNSNARNAGSANAGAVTPVVVAAAPISRGVVLAPNLLKVVSYPANAVPTGAVANITDLGAPGPTGRISLRSLTPNEPVLMTQVTGPGGKLTLAGVVGPGMRAVSVRSNDVAGVAGFVLPGDKVDILLTRSDADQGKPATQVLAENVRVLGVDQISNDDADKPVVARAVTVEVTPDQADLVSLAQAVGAVSFSLRHVADETALEHHSATVADLALKDRMPAAHGAILVARRSKAKPAPPADEAQVRVTRGLETAGYSVSRLY